MRLMTAATTLAITAGTLLSGTTAAFAEHAPSPRPVTIQPDKASPNSSYSCPKLCVWSRTSFRGSSEYYYQLARNRCGRLAFGSRSAINHAGHTVAFYQSSHCTGSYFRIPTGYHTTSTPFTVYSIKVS